MARPLSGILHGKRRLTIVELKITMFIPADDYTDDTIDEVCEGIDRIDWKDIINGELDSLMDPDTDRDVLKKLEYQLDDGSMEYPMEL